MQQTSIDRIVCAIAGTTNSRRARAWVVEAAAVVALCAGVGAVILPGLVALVARLLTAG